MKKITWLAPIIIMLLFYAPIAYSTIIWNINIFHEVDVFVVVVLVLGGIFLFCITFLMAVAQFEGKPIEQTPSLMREKEIIRVVMIPCAYCGGLMPQTAIVCPNCGAKRKN